MMRSPSSSTKHNIWPNIIYNQPMLLSTIFNFFLLSWLLNALFNGFAIINFFPLQYSSRKVLNRAYLHLEKNYVNSAFASHAS